MKSKTSRIKMVSLVPLAALLISMMLVPAGFAAVGVEEGDWVKYRDFSPYSWALTWDQPDYWPENNTKLIDMTVQSVTDNDVEVELTTLFENGTESTKTLSGNVETGSGNLGYLIIPANLGEGLEVPWDHTGVTGVLGAPLKLYINRTVSLPYAGAIREVNYVDVKFVGIGPTRVNLTAYWDKATGVLCEINISVSFGPYGIGIESSTSFKMTETNVWLSHSELESELEDLKDDYETLQEQLDATESNLEEAIADLEASVDDLEEAVSMWQMLTVVLLIVGLAVGFIIAWVVKKPKT